MHLLSLKKIARSLGNSKAHESRPIQCCKIGSHYVCCSLIPNISYYKDLQIIKAIVDESALVVIQNSTSWTQFFVSNMDHTSCSMMMYCIFSEVWTLIHSWSLVCKLSCMLCLITFILVQSLPYPKIKKIRLPSYLLRVNQRS